MEAQQQALIEQYIRAYNNYEVVGMTENLHPDVVFENISNNQVTLNIQGLEASRKQAETAISLFSTRRQEITQWHFDPHQVTIDINYQATLAIDFPNGMKKGECLALTGQSIFQFQEGKIIKITDKS